MTCILILKLGGPKAYLLVWFPLLDPGKKKTKMWFKHRPVNIYSLYKTVCV